MGTDIDGEGWLSAGLLHDLPFDEVAAIEQAGHEETVAAHAHLVWPGAPSDAVRILVAGSAKIYIARQVDGEIGEDILAVLGAGEIVDELSAFEDELPSFHVTTLQPCRLLRFHRADFRRLLLASPVLSFNFHLTLARRLRQLMLRTRAVDTLDVYGRVAWRILSLADRFGVSQPGGDVIIELPLTQKELADSVAATRQNVNIALMYFRRSGAISIAPKTHYITVHNRAALEKRSR